MINNSLEMQQFELILINNENERQESERELEF